MEHGKKEKKNAVTEEVVMTDYWPGLEEPYFSVKSISMHSY